MSSPTFDFFGSDAGVPVPPRPNAGVPAPLQTAPVAPQPRPATTPPAQVVERPALVDIDGDGSVSLDELLTWVVRNDASDLHLISDFAPNARVNGSLAPIPGTGTITAGRLEAMLLAVMNDRQREVFSVHNDIDLAYALGLNSRFRVNIFRQRGKIGAVMRTIPSRVRTCDELGVNPHIRALAQLPRGLILVTGPTGCGKALSLSTLVPTPTGWTTMGALAVGDEVLGRDGQPCTVTALSDINNTPDLYRVTFGDGQVVEADADHQWLVSTHHNRNVPRTQGRLTALGHHAAAHRDAANLDTLAEAYGHDGRTVTELYELLVEHDLTGDLESVFAVTSALHMTDCPSWPGTRPRHVKTQVEREQPFTVYPSRVVLEELAVPRRGRARRLRYAAVAVHDGGAFPTEASADELDALVGLGAGTVRSLVGRRGIKGRTATYTHQYAINEVRSMPVIEFPTAVALKSLALRLRQRFSHTPNTTASLSRLTTADMLHAGLRLKNGPARFAVPVTAPLDLPEADLPVDPYVMGAWLGDGSTASGRFTGLDPEITDEITLAGFKVTHSSVSTKTHHIKGLVGGLRAAGVLLSKHIPVAYHRASFGQRLALVQGLMDTDGTIIASGSCELTLSDRRLADDAITIIRSLGIKASVTTGPSSYRNEAGQVVICKDRNRIKFTTDQSVFRLPRKLARLPVSTRETSGWNYVVGIEPIAPAPVRCISVNSDDHTYLVGDGYLVTSNSTLLAALIDEANQTRRAHILTIEDPIEFTHQSRMSVVTQREVFEDTDSFGSALRAALRQDPDIILLGEMRDLETTHAAITAAETGHLVFGTMHTKSAPETISRTVNMFPKEVQNQIQTTLASCLEAVITQTLVKTIDGTGRAPAQEVMMLAPDSRNLIRTGKLEQLPSVLQTGAERGMQTLTADLARLVKEGRISYEEAAANASDLTELDTKLGRTTIRRTP